MHKTLAKFTVFFTIRPDGGSVYFDVSSENVKNIHHAYHIKLYLFLHKGQVFIIKNYFILRRNV